MDLQSERPRANYPCRQTELYAICEAGWNSCLAFIGAFVLKNTKYIAAYVAGKLADIEAARQLPGFQQRNAVSEEAGIELDGLGSDAVLKWNELEGLIKHSFPEELHKTKIEAAGGTYYTSAAAGDWEDIREMLDDGETFIADNTVALTAGGMPPAFAADYTTAKGAFDDKYDDFMAAHPAAKEATDEKIVANNDIHKDLMLMFGDGVIVMAKEAAKRERFIFARVKELVSSTGAASLEVLVKNRAGGAALATAIITVLELDRAVVTGADGKGKFNTLPSGTYTLLITLLGFEDVRVEEYRVNAGVAQSLVVEMSAV